MRKITCVMKYDETIIVFIFEKKIKQESKRKLHMAFREGEKISPSLSSQINSVANVVFKLLSFFQTCHLEHLNSLF